MEEWRNNFISGFLGLSGISLVLIGIQQASKPATDEFGRVLIIGGLVLSYGAWIFWPVSTPEKTLHTTDHEPSPPSAEMFPKALAAMSIIMSIIWSRMFTTGDDELFWTWVVLLPVYLIFLSHNFLFREGMVKKSIPFTASYAMACIIWIIFLYIHGDPWFWSRGLFTMIMWLSLLPPLSLILLNESLNKSPEKQSMNRIGIVASVPFCVTGIYGVIFFIPTLIILSLGMVLKPRLMIRDNQGLVS